MVQVPGTLRRHRRPVQAVSVQQDQPDERPHAPVQSGHEVGSGGPFEPAPHLRGNRRQVVRLSIFVKNNLHVNN